MDLRASKSGLLWLIMSAWLAIVVLVLGTSALIADEAEESTRRRFNENQSDGHQKPM